MTFFHFVNCVALAYVPYLIVYKWSGLAEYSAFYRCIQAGGTYLVTQLCKMLFLATFFPSSDLPANSFDFMGEVLKASVDLADLVGMYLVMTRLSGKGHLRFLTTGLGWATAELIVTRLLPLWVGARGIEFDWKYMQMSLDSNICLVHHIVTAMLVWLYGRQEYAKQWAPVIIVLLVLGCYRLPIVELMAVSFGLSSWVSLSLTAFYTLTIGLFTARIYASGCVEQVNSR